jgi:hypothetical protein
MKKRGKKVKAIDYDAIERLRVYTMEQIVKCLNDDACNLSSCEIRKHLLDAIE